MAIVYDEVLQIGDADRLYTMEPCMKSIQWLCEIMRITYNAEDIYVDFTARLQAVIRTSHAGIGFDENGKMKKVIRFLDGLETFRYHIHSIAQRDIKSYLQDFFSEEGKQRLDSKCGGPSRLSKDIMTISSGRSPLVTKKGHLGLSSCVIKQGDIIAVIGGAQVPFVLRRRDGGAYSIVSEAYVDGMMAGEATEHSEWGHIKVE